MSAWDPNVTEIVGQFVSATNTTLLGRAGGDLVIYKPTSGNRPLSDFDVATLAQREVLVSQIDRVMGLGLVPETALGDGPYGPGAVQRFITQDEGFDPVPPVRSGDASLWPIAVLDLLVNNADRKLGHILRDRAGKLWAIDHGLCLHPDDKLRTVLWAFAGDPIPTPLLAATAELRKHLDGELGKLVAASLGTAEADALRQRASGLLDRPVFPDPPIDRRPMPWPLY